MLILGMWMHFIEVQDPVVFCEGQSFHKSSDEKVWRICKKNLGGIGLKCHNGSYTQWRNQTFSSEGGGEAGANLSSGGKVRVRPVRPF